MRAPDRLTNPATTLSYDKLKQHDLLDIGFVRKTDQIVFAQGILGGGYDGLATNADVVNVKGVGTKTAEILSSRDFGIRSIGDLARSGANFDRAYANSLSPQQRSAVKALHSALQSCFVLDHPPPL